MSALMAELGHADLLPDDDPGADAHDVVEGMCLPLVVHVPAVVRGTSAAAEVREFFARQRAARTTAYDAGPLPAPEVPAEPVDAAALKALGASRALRLADAASAAGWAVTSTRSRGPWPSGKSLCPDCGTWQGVTKKGTLKVHGPRADRCTRTVLDPTSPTYQVVDSVVVRAADPSGRWRAGAMWVDDGDGWAVARCELLRRGDRPRAVAVDVLVGILRGWSR